MFTSCRFSPPVTEVLNHLTSAQFVFTLTYGYLKKANILVLRAHVCYWKGNVVKWTERLFRSLCGCAGCVWQVIFGLLGGENLSLSQKCLCLDAGRNEGIETPLWQEYGD